MFMASGDVAEELAETHQLPTVWRRRRKRRRASESKGPKAKRQG